MNDAYQILPDTPLPKRALIGIQEKLSIVGEREVARTVTGRAVSLQPAYGVLYAVELSNSGPDVWLPHRFQIGQPVSFASTIWQSTQLAHNQTDIFLPRDAFRIAARDTLTGEEVPVISHSPRSHSIPPRASLTTILYRMRLSCGVFDFQASGSATGREQSWTLRIEEIGG